jgi:hypothetical protein
LRPYEVLCLYLLCFLKVFVTFFGRYKSYCDTYLAFSCKINFSHKVLRRNFPSYAVADISGCQTASDMCQSFATIPTVTNLNSQTISGGIDFYLNGGFHWGIELPVNGDCIGEHLNRFSPPNGQ